MVSHEDQLVAQYFHLKPINSSSFLTSDDSGHYKKSVSIFVGVISNIFFFWITSLHFWGTLFFQHVYSVTDKIP